MLKYFELHLNSTVIPFIINVEKFSVLKMTANVFNHSGRILVDNAIKFRICVTQKK